MDTPGTAHSEDVRPALRYHDAETQTMERTRGRLGPPDLPCSYLDFNNSLLPLRAVYPLIPSLFN